MPKKPKMTPLLPLCSIHHSRYVCRGCENVKTRARYAMTEKMREAARENGKKGGRPRKLGTSPVAPAEPSVA